MPDPTIITSLGVPGLSLFILWKMSGMFVQREREKDATHAAERREFIQRIDRRDEAFRQLEADIRNNLAATLVDAANINKQAVVLMTRRSNKTRYENRA
jgi:hypothetical protein